MHHLQNVIVVHVLSDWFKSCFELLELNNAIFVLIKQGENSSDTVLGFDFTDWWGSDFNELIKLDGFVGLLESVDDTKDKWVSSVNSQLFEDFIDFSSIDWSTSVFIEDFEGWSELFVIDWVKSVLPVDWNWFGNLWGSSWLGGSAHLKNILLIINTN
jgi:hypothetical protein